MKKAILAIISALIVGSISAYALSPYFTESTVNEDLPMGVFIQQKTEDGMKDDTMMVDEMKDDTMMVDEMKDDTMMETIPVSYSGTFVGIGDGIHDAQGKASTIPLDNGAEVLRLEEFKSTNGPDLYVYLSADKTATDFISLGKLKANQGNQNYEIPSEVDLAKYNEVLIWCKTFGVLFGSAKISPQI